MEVFVFFSTFIAVLLWLSPRFFLHADRSVSRRHIRQHSSCASGIDEVIPRPRQTKVGQQPAEGSLTEYSHSLDSLARAIRSHSHSRDALVDMLVALSPTPAVLDLREWLLQGNDIAMGLERCTEKYAEARLFSLLHQSLAHGVFVPQALEQAATILREEVQLRSDVFTAAAQARSSARILTLLPFAVLLLLFLVSPATRDSLANLPVLAVLCLGAFFNRLGWFWVQQLVRRSTPKFSSAASQLSEEVVISLRVGISLRQAIENWSKRNDAGLSHGLSTSRPLSDVLMEFAQRHDEDAQVLTQILIDAERDGLPVVDTVHRLSTEMRSRHRHALEVRIRQLPTKLALPIVLCVLPSFVFLTVVPLVIANLQHFHFTPPPITTSS
jgi:Flp pilus assembly protein TadB